MRYDLGCLLALLFCAAFATTPAMAMGGYAPLQYSPDGTSIIVRSLHGFRVMAARNGNFGPLWEAKGRSHVESFTADSKAILLAHTIAKAPSQEAALVELNLKGELKFKYDTPSKFEFPYVFVADRQTDLFLTGGGSRAAQIWRRGESGVVRSFPAAEMADAAFGPGENEVTIIQWQEIAVRDLTHWTVRVTNTPWEYYDFLEGAFTRNGRSLIVQTSSFTSRNILFSMNGDTLEYQWRFPKVVNYFSIGLNTLATCAVAESRAYVRKFSMEIRRQLKLPYPCGGLAMSPDSRQVVTVDSQRTRVDAWDAKTGKLEWTVKRPFSADRALARVGRRR